MLLPAERPSDRRRGTSEGASQVSSRAWLEEQDLGGFDGPVGEASSKEDFSDLGFSDNYDYGQHLRTIKADGLFIGPDGVASASGVAPRAPGSVAGMSSFSRSSRLSKASIVLREVAEDAFESAVELPMAVGGALSADNTAAAAKMLNEEARAELDDDIWACLHDEEAQQAAYDALGDLNEDFVLQADRPTHLLAVPERESKKQRKARLAAEAGELEAIADAEEEDDDDSEEEEDDESCDEEDGAITAKEAAEAAAVRAEERAAAKSAVAGSSSSGDAQGSSSTLKRRANPFHDLFDDDDAEEELQAAKSKGRGAPSAAPKRAANPFNDMFDDDDDEDEVLSMQMQAKADKATKGRGAKKYTQPLAPMPGFGGAYDNDDDDDDDAQSMTSSRMFREVNVTGEDMGAGRTARFLDERFSKLLSAEYDDEDIGELDPDDPCVNGHEALTVRHARPLPACKARYM